MKKLVKSTIKFILGDKKYRLIQRDLMHKKNKSTDELYVISKYFRNNNEKGTMIDVGVHYGESSELFLDCGWKVYGFEPDDNNRAKISDIVINDKNHKLFDCALSNEEGEMSFYSSPESSGISSLLNFHETHKELKKVKVEVLKNIITKYDISNVKMIKIDTEGYDLFVIKGIDFNRLKDLKVLFCEFEDKKTTKLNYTVLDMIKYLEDQGFKVIVSEWYPIERYGVSHKFKEAKKYPCEVGENAWGNLVAYKSEEFESYFLNKMS